MNNKVTKALLMKIYFFHVEFHSFSLQKHRSLLDDRRNDLKRDKKVSA